MVKMKEITILGRPIQLQERKKAQMKGGCAEENVQINICFSTNRKGRTEINW